MRTSLLFSLLVAYSALLFAAGGCSTPSVNAIYSEDESEVVTDDRVVGSWRQVDKDDQQVRYHVAPRPDDQARFYPVRITEGAGEGEKWGRFELRLVKLGAHTYADLMPDKAERDRLGGRFGLAALAMHVIMPVTIGAESVTLRPLHPDKVRAMVEASPKTTPHALRDKLVILTGTTRQVQEFYRKIVAGDEVFADQMVLSRVGDDGPDAATAPGGAGAGR